MVQGKAMLDDLVAVVVWYNPTEEFVKNILTYQAYCKKTYIIDNTENHDSRLLAESVPNSFYTWNKGNLGIAKALNEGCQQALSDGFRWVMTMDQDSSWESQQLEMYFSRIASNTDPTVVSFSPTPMEPEKNTSVLGDIKRKLFHRAQVVTDDNLIVDRVITSGNVISLEAWSEVGRFYEPLFIDEVDYEFCYRLRDKGLKIIAFPDVKFNHSIGSKKRSFFPKPSHFGVRCYYLTRNSFFMMNKYPKYCKNFHYGKCLLRMLFVNVINLYFTNIWYMYKGYKNYKSGRMTVQ